MSSQNLNQHPQPEQTSATDREKLSAIQKQAQTVHLKYSGIYGDRLRFFQPSVTDLIDEACLDALTTYKAIIQSANKGKKLTGLLRDADLSHTRNELAKADHILNTTKTLAVNLTNNIAVLSLLSDLAKQILATKEGGDK